MLGAIIGDLAGTKYEYQEFSDWKNGVINLERRKEILDLNEPLLTDKSFVSDDSILTIAIAEAILNKEDYGEVLKRYGIKYGNKPLEREGFLKNAFSPGFIKWANAEGVENRKSNGNGSSMRVSPIAYLFDDIETVEKEAKKQAIPTHNEEEAIKGAMCLAGTIFFARKKKSKKEIFKYVTEKYGYNLEYNLEELQRKNKFNGTSKVTVPQAIYVFLLSNSFEDSLRKAISIGGDTDTIACMVGGISEGYYGIPKSLRNKALELLPEELRVVLINTYKLKKEQSKKEELERE